MALLDVAGLEVRYGRIRGTSDVSFAVEVGEVVALIGSNGAGKSSTLKAILGMASFAGGRITFEGKPLAGARTSDLVRRGIAYSPEGRRVFPHLSVAENLRVGGYTRSAEEIGVRMEQVYGYFPRLKERARQLAGSLSGGEQQMLAIGRALMSRPRLFLLDEPSLGLAPIVVERIGDILIEVQEREGLAIVLAEQNAGWALGLAHRGVILELGRTILVGDAAAMMEDPNVRTAYLGV
jgi:branched-chain amino acid transport system ATP-binding protein